MRRKVCGLIFIALSVVAMAGSARSQEITATITGVVTDPSGAVIPGAVITITDVDRNLIRRTLKTSGDGAFAAPLLPIGTYRVTAEAAGFRNGEHSAVKLNVNDKRVLNFALQVGPAKEEATVVSDALRVDLQTTNAIGIVSGTQIRELPLNTRNLTTLVTLQPGVSAMTPDQLYVGLVTPQGSSGILDFAINGGRPGQNNWTLDGVDNLDRGSNLLLLTNPSVEAIEEFRLLRGNYNPEFSSGASGQVVAVTRSGTSKFHGSVYEFFRNDVLSANNFFNNRNDIPRPPLRYNNFGFSVGGPVYIPKLFKRESSKTFFFYSEEWRRVNDYTTFTSGRMPTLAEQQGTFSTPVCTVPIFDPNTGACIGPTTTQITNIDPTAAAYIEDVFSKLPPPEASGTIVSAAANHYDFRGESVRIDHIFNPKYSVFGRLINNDIPTVEPGGIFTGLSLPGVATTRTNSPGRGIAVRLTMTPSPTLLNEVAYAYSYGAIESTPVGSVSRQVSPDISPVLPFASTLGRVPDLRLFAGQSVTGFGRWRVYNRNHAVLDNLTTVASKHTIKLGFAYNHYEKEENNGRDTNGAFAFYGFDPSGNYTFEQEWASFLLGNVANFSQLSTGPPPDVLQNVFEWFVQDEFQVRPNFTLSYGFRWAFFRQPTDGHDQNSTFDARAFDHDASPRVDINTGLLLAGAQTPITNGIIIGGHNSPYGRAIARQNNFNIAPRVGFAWDPFRKGETSIRAAYGIFFDNPPKAWYEGGTNVNPPRVQNVSISNTNLSDPGGVLSDVNLSPGWITGIDPNWSQPYSQQWSLDIQQQLGNSTVIDVGYYGNHGVHLPQLIDINEPRPGAYLGAGVLPQGPIFGYNTQLLNFVRPYPRYSSIDMLVTAFQSSYHSLQAQLQFRHRDFQFGANYTWSHTITDTGSTSLGFTPPQNTYDFAAERSSAYFDRRHIFNASYIYSIPFGAKQNDSRGRLLGGWELSGMIYAESGHPLTVMGADIDPAGLGLFGPNQIIPRPDQLSDPNRGASHTIDQWFNVGAFASPPADGIRPGNVPPNSVRGPGAVRLDAALAKNTRITGRSSLQFRVEATNVLNHTNLDNVGTWFLDSSSFGKVTSARDPRIIQLGLKLLF